MRILIDECLSQKLVAAAKMRDHDATHVVFLGKKGWQDYNLMDLILDGDYVFVTRNGKDFRKLYSLQPLHNGLVILIPQLETPDQVRLFEAALDFIATLGDTVNRVIEVFAVDDIRLSNLPPPEDA